jgi:hypothetical protein
MYTITEYQNDKNEQLFHKIGFESESVLDVTDTSSKIFYLESVWNLLSATYSSVSGGLNYSSPNEMIKKTSRWVLGFSNGSLVCAILVKQKAGNKIVAFGATQDPSLRHAGREILESNLPTMLKKNCWMEVSGKAEKFVLSLVELSLIIPNVLAARLTNKLIINLCSNGTHYIREICSIPKKKVIVGSPIF